MSCSEIEQLKKMIQYKQQKRGGLAARAGKAGDSADCSDTIFFYDNSGVSFDVDCCIGDICGNCNENYDPIDCCGNLVSCDDCDCEFQTCNSINKLSYRCKKCIKEDKCPPNHPLPWAKDCKDKCAIQTATKKRINKEVGLDYYGRLNRIRMSLNPDPTRECGKNPFYQNKTEDRIRFLIPAPRHMSKCCLDEGECPVNSSSCPDLVDCSCN